jgi:NAD(P)-dependent dehydrogenase (short-subunit alcohol dehydrogenase family)
MIMTTVLVTGTSTGFGYHLARGLRRAGHRPTASMREIAASNAAERSHALEAEGIPVVEIGLSSVRAVAQIG